MKINETVTKNYMRQKEVFADVFNYSIYDGEQMVHPDSLKELNTYKIYNSISKRYDFHPSQIDSYVMKSSIAMMDKKCIYLLLPIDKKLNNYYEMSIISMLCESSIYEIQVEEGTDLYLYSADYKKGSRNKSFSGFKKGDRIKPVITVVVYFDSKEWNGLLSIHELITKTDEEELAFIPNYKMNLIVTTLIEDKDFDRFHSSLKEVLSFIKHANDEDGLKSILESNKNFQHLGKREVEVLNACVDAKIPIK